MNELPPAISYYLDEAATLLWDLESAREPLGEFEALSPLAGIEHQIVVLHRKLFDEEAEVSESIAEKAHRLGALTLVEAARLSGIPGPELAKAVIERRIRSVMVDGIAHIPPDALDEFRRSERAG